MGLLSWLFGEKEEKPPEPLVLGAELECKYGMEHTFLIVQSDDMNINDLPEACVSDREKSVNIMPFGYCSFGFTNCSMLMELEEQWENEEPQKMLSNGKEVITTKSTLLCRSCGGEIRAVTSGQDGVEAERITKEIELVREMEEKYPGLLDILVNPYGSLYLEEGMYQAALQFLEDRVEENNGEVWILELYSDRNLKNTLITSCLEKLLTVSGMESENAVITKLNNMGIRNGEEPGWDVHTLNKEMIGMLKQDCEGTAKKIKNNSFSRWKEEHKQELDWYCESFTEFAYLAVIYSLSISTGRTEIYKQEASTANAKKLGAGKSKVTVNGRGDTGRQTINNKFPGENQAGRTFKFTIEDGRINIENGIQEVDFVIDMDGNLHIGRGHSYLANGKSVQAAGTMKVNTQGYIRLITNESGHYQPTVTQAMNYPDIFRNAGVIVDNAWIRISEFKTSMSNYVVDKNIIYHGIIKYMPH